MLHLSRPLMSTARRSAPGVVALARLTPLARSLHDLAVEGRTSFKFVDVPRKRHWLCLRRAVGNTAFKLVLALLLLLCALFLGVPVEPLHWQIL